MNVEYTKMQNDWPAKCNVREKDTKRSKAKHGGLCNGKCKNQFWKGYLVGLCTGTAVFVVILLIMNNGGDHKNSCLNLLQNFQSKNSSFMNITTKVETTFVTTEESSAPPRYASTSPSYLTTEKPFMLHTCSAQGGCTNPPKLHEGTECIYESKDGRAAARYTALAKRDIDTFEHCPVSVCRGNNNWGTFNISFSSGECYTNSMKGGAVYKGKITCTVTGRRCQRWDRDYPHKRNMKLIPKNLDDLRHNYCRDPGDAGKVPWCYTTDPKVRWEFCHVTRC